MHIFIMFVTLLFYSNPSDAKNTLQNDQKWSHANTQTLEAWKINSGDKRVIVAIVDTGADISHSDLRESLWINSGERGTDRNGKDKAKNGIDDDGNGYIDDIYGWNFVDNNNNLLDSNGHGTHIAGIIGGKSSRNPAMSGVSPNVSLMILKYFDSRTKSQDNLNNTVRAIKYAIKMGARIINYSSGGTTSSSEEEAVILEAQSKGIVFVAAAGNEGENADKLKYFPASYESENIIAVTAIDPKIQILSSSNYGQQTVDIAAPGKSIYSTLQNNNYGYMTGTSQATAQVSGALALFLAEYPEFKDPRDIKSHLLLTSHFEKNLETKTLSSGRLDTLRILAIKGHGYNILGFKPANPYRPIDY